MTRSLFVLSLLTLAACGASEKTWRKDLVRINCEIAAKCSKLYFSSSYDNVAECAEEQADVAEDYEDYYDDCDFDKKEASKCLAAYRKVLRSCDAEDAEDAYDDCDKVWDCE